MSAGSKEVRCAIYLRVSTADQTTDNQQIDLERAAAQRGWRVVETYVDHGVSGAKGRDARPEFDRLCRDAAAGKVDIVAAWSIDRIGRNLQHLIAFFSDLRAQRVGLYLHRQQVDTTTAAGRAFLQMAGVFAEFEREVIVERINAGIARARAQGTRSGRPIGRPPISPAKQRERSRRIAALRDRGYGVLKIARELRCGVGTVRAAIASRAAAAG